MKTNNTKTNNTIINELITSKNLHFRNNLDVCTKNNVKLFQVRNNEKTCNAYMTMKEYEMIKDIKLSKGAKVVSHENAKKPYMAINELSKNDLSKCLDRVMKKKGL